MRLFEYNYHLSCVFAQYDYDYFNCQCAFWFVIARFIELSYVTRAQTRRNDYPTFAVYTAMPRTREQLANINRHLKGLSTRINLLETSYELILNVSRIGFSNKMQNVSVHTQGDYSTFL